MPIDWDEILLRAEKAPARVRRGILRQLGCTSFVEIQNIDAVGTLQYLHTVILASPGVVNVHIKEAPNAAYVEVIGGSRSEVLGIVDRGRPVHIDMTVVVYDAARLVRFAKWLDEILWWWQGNRAFFPWPRTVSNLLKRWRDRRYGKRSNS